MPLSDREIVIVHVSNALTAYAVGRAENRIPMHIPPHRFVLDTVPEAVRPLVTADTVDEVFAALQTVHK